MRLVYASGTPEQADALFLSRREAHRHAEAHGLEVIPVPVLDRYGQEPVIDEAGALAHLIAQAGAADRGDDLPAAVFNAGELLYADAGEAHRHSAAEGRIPVREIPVHMTYEEWRAVAGWPFP
jgi:hypothetical protein